MVRRFFLFFAVVCLVGSLAFLPKSGNSLRINGVTVFASSPAELPEGTVWTANGSGMVIETDMDRLPEILALVDVSGITFSTDNRVSEIVSHLGGKVEKKEVLKSLSIENYYLSVPSLKNFVEIDGKKIGAQIAVTPNGVLVGFPLLLGGY